MRAPAARATAAPRPLQEGAAEAPPHTGRGRGCGAVPGADRAHPAGSGSRREQRVRMQCRRCRLACPGAPPLSPRPELPLPRGRAWRGSATQARSRGPPWARLRVGAPALPGSLGAGGGSPLGPGLFRPPLRLFPGCSRAAPAALAPAMPVAAAAPLISSVQKLVLYETRAVSSAPPPPPQVPGLRPPHSTGGMSRPAPGVLAWLCPELLPRLGGCSLSKTTPYLSLRVLGSGSFWSHTQSIPRAEKNKVLKFLFSLCHRLVPVAEQWPLRGRAAQGPAVGALPRWERRLGPCLLWPGAAVTLPGYQGSPQLKLDSWRCPELIFDLRMAELVTTCTSLFAVYDTLQSSLSETFPKFSVWPLGVSSWRFPEFLTSCCRNSRHALFTVLVCHGQCRLEVGVVIAALAMWWAQCESEANSWCKYHVCLPFLSFQSNFFVFHTMLVSSLEVVFKRFMYHGSKYKLGLVSSSDVTCTDNRRIIYTLKPLGDFPKCHRCKNDLSINRDLTSNFASVRSRFVLLLLIPCWTAYQTETD